MTFTAARACGESTLGRACHNMRSDAVTLQPTNDPPQQLCLLQSARTAAGLPVELDVRHAALLVEQRVRVHAKALHMPVVGRDANVVLEERELRAPHHDHPLKSDKHKPAT